MTLLTERTPDYGRREYRAVAGAATWRELLVRLAAGRPPRLAETPSPRYRRILLPVESGTSAIREGLLAHALSARGASVVFLLNDEEPFGTDASFAGASGERSFPEASETLAALRHTALRLSSFVSPERAESLRRRAMTCSASEIASLTYRGVAIRNEVEATLSGSGRSELDPGEASSLAASRRRLSEALVATEAAAEALRRLAPDKLFIPRETSVHARAAAALARAMRFPFDLHEEGSRRNTITCRHGDGKELCEAGGEEPGRPSDLTREEDEALTDFLAKREAREYASSLAGVEGGASTFLSPSGAFQTRVCLLAEAPKIDGDANGAFGSVKTWMRETIRFYESRPGHVLIVQPAPCENGASTRDAGLWLDSLRDSLGALPDNVVWVSADHAVGPFALSRTLDMVLVHRSDAGLQFALLGVPVMTTGAGASFEREGIVLRAASRLHYFEELQRALDRTQEFTPDLAASRRFAYETFFRGSLPFEPVELDGSEPRGIAIESLAELAPGRFAGVDAIVSGVLDGARFEIPRG